MYIYFNFTFGTPSNKLLYLYVLYIKLDSNKISNKSINIGKISQVGKHGFVSLYILKASLPDIAVTFYRFL